MFNPEWLKVCVGCRNVLELLLFWLADRLESILNHANGTGSWALTMLFLYSGFNFTDSVSINPHI